MWTEICQPRFSETDALGHVNNTVLPVWFETGRTPIFKLFAPELDPNNWPLIIARIEVDYVGELFYGKPVEIRTFVLKLGNSSMTIGHEAWQDGELAARGKAVMIHYDHNSKSSMPVPAEIRSELEQHLRLAGE
ncbi:acyl-CoA thioesterase [Oceanobacter mangrovi]|uniref:acyl-CoA thioesterase n=1 Tax=Oceanobacter mangrovi TaxID=2862510 RepID=UPI001C8DD9D9|nr:thioesterase family protein [Oceanobacter mangrovi]